MTSPHLLGVASFAGFEAVQVGPSQVDILNPALPGRSITARLSPTLVHHAVRDGWKP